MSTEGTKVNPCPEIPFFGASYPDATCIDGWLWDLDKFSGGGLYGGPESACPFCNTESFIEEHIDEEDGWSKENIQKQINHWQERYGSPNL